MPIKRKRYVKKRPRLENLDDMSTRWILDAFELQGHTKNRQVRKPIGRKNWIRFSKLMLCTKCNYVWQILPLGNGCAKFRDMPTIGLERRISTRCKPKKET